MYSDNHYQVKNILYYLKKKPCVLPLSLLSFTIKYDATCGVLFCFNVCMSFIRLRNFSPIGLGFSFFVISFVVSTSG